jgi:hypothetical protein
MLEYAWISEDETRDREFTNLLEQDLSDFADDRNLSGLLVLIKEEFVEPEEAAPHFLHSYKLGSVKRASYGIGFPVRPDGALVRQDYVATADNGGYSGTVTILICGSFGYSQTDKEAALYALERYKVHIESVYPEWKTVYQGQPHIQTKVDWSER